MSISQNFSSVKPSLNLNFARSKTLDPRITFARTSTATYVGSDGLIKTATQSQPRFDHDPTTRESLGLLIESARTNLITDSEDFSKAFWTRFDCSVAKNAVAPDGTNNATTVTRNSTSYGYVFIIRYSQSVTTGQAYTFSVFLKGGTHAGEVQISLDSSGGGGYPFNGVAPTLTVNISNGSVIGSSAGLTYTVTPYSNGWYRYSITATATADGTAEYSVNTGTMSLNNYFYMWGAQLEISTFVTSYIPTGGAAVTRTADIATMTDINFSDWYNKFQGTLYTKYIRNQVGNNFLIGLGYDGSNYIGMGYNNNDVGPIYLQPLVVYFPAINGSAINTSTKSIVSYSSSGASAAINGGTVSELAAVGSLPSGSNGVLYFGSSPFSPASIVCTRISHVLYFSSRLSNSQIQQLTK